MSKKSYDPIKLVPSWAKDKPKIPPLYQNLIDQEESKEIQQHISSVKFAIKKPPKIKYNNEPKGVIRMEHLSTPKEIFDFIIDNKISIDRYNLWKSFIPNRQKKVYNLYLSWKLLPNTFKTNDAKEIIQNDIGNKDYHSYLTMLTNGSIIFVSDVEKGQYIYKKNNIFNNDEQVIIHLIDEIIEFTGYGKNNIKKESESEYDYDEFDELRDQWNEFQGLFPNIGFGDFLIMAGNNFNSKKENK